MPDLEFYESPDFWLNKKLEAMDNIEVFGFETSSNATDCEYEDSFISNTQIDTKTLIKDLNSPYFKKHKFDAEKYVINRLRSKNYKINELKNREAVKDNLGGIQNKAILNKSLRSEDQLSKEIEDLYHQLLSSSLSLNTTECYIDTLTRNNSFDVNIDIYNKKVTYSYTIHFKKADKYPAIQLKTNSVGSFFFFLEKVYGKREANILRRVIYIKFVNALKSASSIDTLVFLYDNLPYYVKRGYSIESEEETKPYKIPDTLLWKHFVMFVNADRGLYDASYYVLYTMTLMTPKYCIKKFREDQSFVIQVYNGLDDRNIFDRLIGSHKYSETFSIGKNTLEPSNKDVFVTLLNSYIQLHEKDADVTVFEPLGAHFHQGILNLPGSDGRYHKATYWLNTDTKLDKVYILNRWESYKGLGYTLLKDGRSVQNYSFTKGYNEEGYYDPLDVVKFTQYNDKGEPITTNVPILLVYHANYVKDWERINQGMRLGMNVLMIVAGAATIYSGVGSLMLYATLADIGLATTDIIIQGKVKDEIKRGDFSGKSGKDFLESWDKIYTYVGLATFSPVAINAVKAVATYGPKMVTAGADLLQVAGKRVIKKKAYEKVKEFTLKAIHSLEIPNFNKTGMQILERGVRSIPELKKAGKLQDVGVIFVKGAENTYAAIYKGVTIASGKVKIVALQLRRALRKLRGKQLEEYLEELRYLGGMAENIRTTKNVDLFLASASRLSALKITSKNALKYLDDVLPHFNHKVVEYVVDGVVKKVVVKIGDLNCASVAKVVDEYLKTGVFNKAESIGLSGFDYFGKSISDFPRLSLPSMQKVMKDGERGIIYGELMRRTSFRNGEPIIEVVGHYFNVIKKDGILLYKDGQIGGNAIIGFKQYESFRYLKTN